MSIFAALLFVALGVVGCGSEKASTMESGDCGYLVDPPGKDRFDFRERGCNNPEAAVRVVRGWKTQRCPAGEFEEYNSSKRGSTTYVCLQLNAEVGDCFTDVNSGMQLAKLRKIPCTEPGAFQVNAKSASRDDNVCTAAIIKQHPGTDKVKHSDKSYCLHPIGG
ncbi:hypothetical protein ACLMAJ_20615 [Nocardia sp. KC 131]|uniref:hypothetical protein n=1 Tax=Nocardia arseniciresistens TaxID=3392119 RepID=UPI00398E5950